MGNIKVNKISTNYEKIDEEKYNSILSLAANEKFINHNRLLTKTHAYRRSLEIIDSVNNKADSRCGDSLTYHFRYSMNFDNNTEKQAFINNFMFDGENFAHALEINDISKDDIENLINEIKAKKKEAKITKNYDLEIDNIISIDGISKYYNLANKELVINMMIELYTLRKELLDSKVKKIVK